MNQRRAAAWKATVLACALTAPPTWAQQANTPGFFETLRSATEKLTDKVKQQASALWPGSDSKPNRPDAPGAGPQSSGQNAPVQPQGNTAAAAPSTSLPAGRPAQENTAGASITTIGIQAATVPQPRSSEPPELYAQRIRQDMGRDLTVAEAIRAVKAGRSLGIPINGLELFGIACVLEDTHKGIDDIGCTLKPAGTVMAGETVQAPIRQVAVERHRDGWVSVRMSDWIPLENSSWNPKTKKTEFSKILKPVILETALPLTHRPGKPVQLSSVLLQLDSQSAAELLPSPRPRSAAVGAQ